MMTYTDNGYGFEIIGKNGQEYFTLSNLCDYLNKNKSYLTEYEKFIASTLNDAYLLLKNDLPCGIDDLVTTILLEDDKEWTLEFIDSERVGDDEYVLTIVGNIIARKTNLSIGYYQDEITNKGYIMYEPQFPASMTKEDLALKSTDDLDNIFNELKKELISKEFDQNVSNDFYSVHHKE